MSRTRLTFHTGRKPRIVPALGLAFTLAMPMLVTSAPRAAAQAPLTAVPGLSASQKQQVAARRAKLQKDLDALQADKSQSDAKKQKTFEKLEADYATDITMLLTPEQKKAILDRRNEEAALRKQREAEFHDVTVKILDLSNKIAASLTPEQSKKIDQIKEDAKTKAQKINGDSSLSAAQKDKGIGKIEDGMEQQVNAILNADQRQMFSDMQGLEQRQIQLMNGAKPKS